MKASIEGYRAFIAANPKDISAHGELGNVLYTAGAFPEASQAYFEAASLAIEQNQIEVAEALVPAVIEGNPMLAHELTGKLFDHQVRTNLSQREQAEQKQAKQG
jgi:cytochrome c-type biogenesis protein CcmH/NrfG